MQLRILIALFLSLPVLISAQRLPRLIPYVSGEYFGLADSRMQMIVDSAFTDALPERRNLTFVQKLTPKGLRWGALDPYGKEMLPFEFLEVRPLEKAVVVRTDSGYGLMSYSRTYLHPPIYTDIGNFSEGIAVVKSDSSFGYLTITGKEIVPPEYGFAARFRAGRGVTSKDGSQYVFDRGGKLVFQASYTSMMAFADEVTVFKSGDRYGVIDKYGKIVVLPRYAQIRNFENGWAACKLDSLWGIMYKSGKEMLPCEYDMVRIRGEWPAAVKKGENWALMGQEKAQITEFVFNNLSAVSDGILVAEDESGAWYSDPTGQAKHTEQYAGIALPGASPFQGEIGAVRNETGYYALVTRTGERLSSFKYDRPNQLSEQGPLILKMQGKFGAVDRLGKQVVPFIYDQLDYMWSGVLRAVRKNAIHYYDVHGNGYYEHIGD